MVGSEFNRTRGKQGKKRGENGSRAREHSPRQLLSRTLLSEPLVKATVSKGSENTILSFHEYFCDVKMLSEYLKQDFNNRMANCFSL